VSGRGYYVTGPVLDVPGRPVKVKPSFYVLILTISALVKSTG